MKFMSQCLRLYVTIHTLILQYWLSKILDNMFSQNIHIITPEVCLNNTKTTLIHFLNANMILLNKKNG